MNKINTMSLKFLSKSDNVAFSRVVVASFASQLDFTVSEIEEIKVATSEAVSNSIIHGYGESVGHVCVHVELYPDRVEIEVEDSGKGIEDVPLAMKPSFSTNPERMGLGFAFMESFMDKLNIDSTVGVGTKVRLIKYVTVTDFCNNNQSVLD